MKVGATFLQARLLAAFLLVLVLPQVNILQISCPQT